MSATTVLAVDGMRCKKNCASKVAAALEGVAGVRAVQTNFPARQFTVHHDAPQAAAEQLVAAVAAAGPAFRASVVGLVEVRVDGMRCRKNCASKVEAALRGVEGVGEVVVDFAARSFRVAPALGVRDDHALREAIVRAVRGAGSGNFVPSFPDHGDNHHHGDGDGDVRRQQQDNARETQPLTTAVGSEGLAPSARKPRAAHNDNNNKAQEEEEKEKEEEKREEPSGTVVTLMVSGMSCANCSSGIERKLRAVPAVVSATVSVVTSKAVVTTRPGTLAPNDIQAMVRELGYGATVVDVAPGAAGARADHGETVTLTFFVVGMTCASCQQRVEGAVRALAGVDSVAVSLVTGKCAVKHRPVECAPSTVFDAVAKLGFEVRREDTGGNARSPLARAAEPTQLELLQKQESEALRRDLRWSLLFTVPVFFLAMVVPGNDAGKRALVDTKVLNVPLKDVLLLVLVSPVHFCVGKRFHSRAWKAVRHGTSNMDVLVSLGTSAAYCYSVLLVLCMLASSSFHRQTFFETSAMLITFILLGKYLETFARHRTSQALATLLRLQPPTANLVLLRDNDPSTVVDAREVAVEEVLVGDVVRVRAGERVPTDGVVIHGSCSVDESMVTGESMHVQKHNGCGVVGGTVVQSGSVLVRVERVGNDTALSQIVRLVEEVQTSKAPIQSLADRIAAVFVPTVIAISVATFVVWVSLGLSGHVPDSYYERENADEALLALIFAISVLVISCPCSLGLATPTAVVAGTGRGAALGILIKGADVLQQAGRVRAVVFDKTGTLSKGVPEVTGLLFPDEGGAWGEGGAVRKEELLALVASAEEGSSHPLAAAVCRYAEGLCGKDAPRPTPTHFEALEGLGLRCRVEGREVVVGNREMLALVGVDVPPGVEEEAVVKEEEGETVVFVCVDGAFAAGISIADTAKDGAAEVVAKLKAWGIDTLMLTGDNVRTATAVGRSLGISKVVAQTKPQDKAAKVRQLQREYRGKGLVAMVGDGTNDSPALVAADLGIAIGTGTEVAVEAADIVLMKSSLWGVVEAIDLSRTIFRRIRINFVWAFVYNVLALPLAAGVFYPFTHQLLQPHWAGAAMAASSICVVLSSLHLSRYQPPRPGRVRRSLRVVAVRSSVAPAARQEGEELSLLKMEQGESSAWT